MRLWKPVRELLKPPDNRISGQELLQQLQTDADVAWQAFVLDYAGVIYASIQTVSHSRGFQAEDDLVWDIYADILEKLKANDYDRLKSYRGESQFHTWLTSVCHRACTDYLRSENPPPEMPKPITELSEVHQSFFRFRYIKGHEVAECHGYLENLGFQLSDREFVGVVFEVESVIPQWARERFPHWQASEQPVSIDAEPDDENALPAPTISTDETPENRLLDVENQTLLVQIKAAIEGCKAELTDREKIVIDLSYWQALKTGEVAEILKLKATRISRIKHDVRQKLKACLLRQLQHQGYTAQDIQNIVHNLGDFVNHI